MTGPCLCGDTECPVCGTAQGTYRPRGPTPAEIRAMRDASGLTQTEAGALVRAPLRTWQDWEYGKRRMPALAWEVFQAHTRRKRQQ